MISQIPALQTNVIATVRREANPVVGDLGSAQQRSIRRDEPFQLNNSGAAAKDIPVVENDNFASSTFNLAAVHENASASTGRSLRGYAREAYALAETLTAYAPYRAVSLSI